MGVDQKTVTDTLPTAVETKPTAPAPAVEPKAPVDARAVFDDILQKRGKMPTSEAPAPKAQEKPETPAPQAKQEQPPVDAKERDRALAALRRAKAPESVMSALDDQALMKWGRELADQQAEVDRRLSAPKPRADEEHATTAKPEPAKAGTPEPVATPDKESDELLATLTDYLDDGGTKALARLIDSKVERLVSERLKQAADTQRADIAPLAEALVELKMNDTLRGLQGRFPKLADPDLRASVREKMLAFYATGHYASDQDAAVDACRAIFYDQSDPGVRDRNLDLDRRKDAGQGALTGKRAGPIESSAEDRSKAGFMQILANRGFPIQ